MFPELTITSISEQEKSVLGTLSRTDQGREHWIDDGYVGALLSGDVIAFGRWHKREGAWRFTFNEREWGKFNLQNGQVVQAIDGYWGERIELVFSPEFTWEKVTYSPKGQSDHIHCLICWSTISKSENSEYYSGGKYTGVCKECFSQYIAPKNIGFVPRGA